MLLSSPPGTSPGDLSSKAPGCPKSHPQKTWQALARQESLALLSWLVALSGTFVLIGVIGILRYSDLVIPEFSGKGGTDEREDGLMAALGDAMAENDEPTTALASELEPEVPDVPEPVEMPVETPDVLDLEPTEALVEKDVFVVPAAPKVETALTPVDPVKPKPVAQPKTTRPRTAPRSNAPTPGTTGRGAATGSTGSATGTGTGTGGTGTGSGGRGRAKGYTPKPVYPESAKRRRVTGIVYFRLRISPEGRILQADVVSSNCVNGGFTSAEQSMISADICRRWKQPGYPGQTITAPIRFTLE